MRQDKDKKFKPAKRRINIKTGPAIPVHPGHSTWSKNSFRKQPLQWKEAGIKAGQRVTKLGRIQVNTNIFINNMQTILQIRKDRAKAEKG